MNLGEFYKNKKVFVTGHSGFKGSWLCFFLNNLGAETYGYSLEPDNSYQPLYYLFNTNEDCSFDSKDIRDFDNLNVSIKEFNPDIVFHLAAQPLVIKSYENPIDTFSTNIMGTSNLLEICKSSESIKAVINITSDKCYENKNSIKLYTENDRLGRSDL